ncbi:MAG: SIS domain-containing protein [Chloroflexi bacterium]|nr:SIS domain-containing protein [Chloroflexota bacterium]MYD17862.1 SIS domain-containing protein [Chloroflexota bacterium]MYJ00822.1 SIS domain-containing protein [Chloroflexota bacterium]
MTSVSDYRLYPAIQAQPSECAKVLSSAQPFDRAAQTLSEATRVWTVGIGTSYNAANAAAWMLRAAGLEARPLTSFEFATWPAVSDDDAVLLFAHTGRKTWSGNSLALCIDRGISVVLVTKIETGFDLESFPDHVTVLHTTTQDPSSMYTVSHTTAMTAAAKIADLVSPGSIGDTSEIPSALASALALEDEIAELAAEWSEGALIALGAGPMLAAAEEAHIKIAEASRRQIRHQEPESFLHGPVIQLLDSNRVTTFAANDGSAERSRAITQLTMDMGCSAAWVAPRSVAAPESARHLVLAELSPELLGIPAVVPGQLLAAHLAANDDINADDFRTDVPEFLAALSKLSL